uniref:Leucine rich immune protein (Coil-less) n=1 Tax=Anopheles albimanus TaxID=7167 RepID=A0A182FF38_ANOAL
MEEPFRVTWFALVIASPTLLSICRGELQCTMWNCEFPLINMSAGGAATLRRLVDEAYEIQYPTFALVINKLIIGSFVSSEFVTFLGRLTDSIEFFQFHDAVFPLPSDASIKKITITPGSKLRIFSAGRNNFLESLFIGSTLLTSVPASLVNLPALKELYVTNYPITTVHMDVFASNSQLEHVNLSSNKIKLLLPSTANDRQTYSIQKFDLSRNQLDHLEMTVFYSMPKLERLVLAHNVFPRYTYITIGLRTLRRDGRLVQIPKLITLYIHGNNIKQLDLSVLQANKDLMFLLMEHNKFRTLRASKPLRLNKLKSIDAEYNNITSVNFTLCDFPNIRSISLRYNRLKSIPPIFDRFPEVTLRMRGNPLSCGAIQPFKTQLVEGRLVLSTTSTENSCSTTSFITIDSDWKVCCDL